MIASLMMYRRPQLDAAHGRYWQLIREHLRTAGIDSPDALSQDAEEFAVWTDPDLVLSQTCGMPYRTWLHDKVTLVGTPDFGLPDCPPGHYNSALIVRADDQRASIADFIDGTFAYNQTFSQSGYGAPYWHLHPLWFSRLLHTEQHLLSARAVADGRADIASIDAVTWRLITQYEPFARDLRVLDWTEPTPGLPLITSKGRDAAAIFDAVAAATDQLEPRDKEALGLKSLICIPKSAYLAVPNPS